jgi:hypothetical protein
MERDDDKRAQVNGAPPQRSLAGNGSDVRADSPPEGRDERHAEPPADAINTWRLIAGQLVALIGESGFCALFGRAIRMLRARYDWLSIDPSANSIDILLGMLERDMAGAEAAVADRANTELLQTFTGQLSTLIGEALTVRLVTEARALKPEGREDAREYH